MLYLTWEDVTTGVKKQMEWHAGQPLPVLDIRVVTFQADGHELEMLIRAMKETRNPS